MPFISAYRLISYNHSNHGLKKSLEVLPQETFLLFLHQLLYSGSESSTPLCRVQLSFEPAFAGWVPPQMLRLGSSLSRHTQKIGTHLVSVGPKPECSITHTVGLISYTIKKAG
jgi:hypothetical protein